MFKPNLLFAIDVSGVPPKKTCISCVSFAMHKSEKLFNDLKKTFPRHYKKKGKDLDHDILFTIMEVLDKHKNISYSTIYTSNSWNYVLRMPPRNRAYKIEKICGIVYYVLLQKNSKYRTPYIVHVCKENFMKVDTVISSCRTIAKMRGMEYNITVGSGNYDKYIKIADYVAAATRKIKEERLHSLKYYNLIKAHLPDEFVKKVFN